MSVEHQLWLALVIGNSRWHWGAFEGDRWLGCWHTAHLSEAQVQVLKRHSFSPSAWSLLDPAVTLPPAVVKRQAFPELWMASVVDAPVPWLADHPLLHQVTTAEVPLHNTYPTLGVDRALALVGAGETWGWPVLVIDCGTALTFTAGAEGRLLGGAILPGVRSQLRALHTHTDRLPALNLDPSADPWPQRWATDTAGAIASGILHTQLAGMRDFIQAWRQDWPRGAVVLTGGDSLAYYHVVSQSPLAQRISHDLELGFWGLRVCRQHAL
ncbi:MAG: pantothenate kinase [Nodosilinea sp.]